jgi:hypothetical protein
MAKKLIAGPRHPRRSVVPFAGSIGKDSCWKPLTSESRARAEKAQSSSVLFLLDGELLCECGAHVGARPSQMGVLEPTFHYPHKPSRPLAPAKVYAVKRLR